MNQAENWTVTDPGIIINDSSIAIAIPCNGDGHRVEAARVVFSRVTPEERAANAVLLAAAPKLRDERKATLTWLRLYVRSVREAPLPASAVQLEHSLANSLAKAGE